MALMNEGLDSEEANTPRDLEEKERVPMSM